MGNVLAAQSSNKYLLSFGVRWQVLHDSEVTQARDACLVKGTHEQLKGFLHCGMVLGWRGRTKCRGLGRLDHGGEMSFHSNCQPGQSDRSFGSRAAVEAPRGEEENQSALIYHLWYPISSSQLHHSWQAAGLSLTGTTQVRHGGPLLGSQHVANRSRGIESHAWLVWGRPQILRTYL